MKNYYMLIVRLFSVIAVVLILNAGLTAQELVSYEKIISMTKDEINSSLFVQAEYDVDVYRIEYTTLNIAMEKDTASGIVSIAVDEKLSFPVMLYDHGTVDNRLDVPSEESGEHLLTIAYASFGYHCIAPDYIGLGISEGVHPYVHPESEARAGIDLIYAVKTLEDKEPVFFNDQLFVTGYSQGGHAALATCRELQSIEDLVLTAAAPMSGPYSVSKEMKVFTMGDEEYFFCAYLGSVILSAKLAYPDLLSDFEIEDVFKPEYAALVRQFEEEQIGLFDMNDQMILLLSADGGKVFPKRMFIDNIKDEIINNDDHSINKALKRMDVCNWVPAAPIKFMYCTADDQVTYRNAVYTDSLMNALGAPNVSSLDVFSLGDHGQCVLPASLQMINFFKQYQQIDIVSTTDIDQNEIAVWPNPGSNKLTITADNFPKQSTVEIYTYQGELLETMAINSNNEIDISQIPNGFYFLRIFIDESFVLKKIIIQR